MNVLIVDDKEENLYLLETLLKSMGYEVVSASNGAEALEKLHTEDFDLIISDVLMPEMDGFQLCKNVKMDNKLKDIPVIFLTASYLDEKDEQFALKLGVDKFIRKPFEPDEFIKNVQCVIRDAVEGRKKETKPVLEEEKEIFKMYSERVVSKLEETTLELEESERKYRNLCENVNDMIFSLDEEGCFTAVNRRLEMFGYTSGDVIGKHFTKILIPKSREVAAHYFEQVKKGSSAHDIFEVDIIRKDDTTANIEINMSSIYRKGEFLGGFGIARDITERKKAERELQNSMEKLRKTLEGIIQAMALTAEARDQYTAGHQRRVADLACAIAEEMNLSEEQIDGIRMAGVIHDIGKISVPAEILSKPGRITDIEFSLIKTHSQVGYDILKEIEFPWPIAQIILQHHERIDGSGYPSGLKGEEILLEAKVLAVADVIEAIASHRPYRPSLGIDKALEEISRNKGIFYDSDVVDACLRLFKEKDFKM